MSRQNPLAHPHPGLLCPGFALRDTSSFGADSPRGGGGRDMMAKQRAVVGAIVSFGLGVSAWLTFVPGQADAG